MGIKDSASSVMGRNSRSRTILAINSHSIGHIGQIRLSIIDDMTLTEGDLYLMTPREIEELNFEFKQQMEIITRKTGMFFGDDNISIIYRPKVAILNSYVRNSGYNSYWVVKIYTFPDSKHNRMVLLTVSFDLSKRKGLESIFNEVVQSLIF